jgi:glycine hydroxymethyltransferase
MHVIAAKAVAFLEAMSPEFKSYQGKVIDNARAMAAAFAARGFKIVSAGTDNHLVLLRLLDKDITGKDADAALGRANITVNKNTVPNDPRSPFVTSGLRLGTPAITTRRFGVAETAELTGWICDVLDDIHDDVMVRRVRGQVLELCRRFPVYT